MSEPTVQLIMIFATAAILIGIWIVVIKVSERRMRNELIARIRARRRTIKV